MSPSIWQLLIVAILLVLLFGGRGKISSIMGDVAKGIRSFRSGLNDDESKEESAPKSLSGEGGETIDGQAKSETARDKTS